jgi:hypothetical protein
MLFLRRSARALSVLLLVVFPAIAHAADPLQAALSFDPMTISVGATSVMSIEITNPNAIGATGLAVSDVYPAGIFNASPAHATTTCGGTVNATAGASSFTMSGGTLAAQSTCVIAIDVTGAQGMWVNALDPGTVTSGSVPANAFFSTALLIVEAGQPSAPEVTLTFTPNAIHAGKTTTLSFAISNPSASAMRDLAFGTEVPQALINSGVARSTCGGSIVAKPGSRTITLTGGSIAAGGTCSVEVGIRGTVPGSYAVVLPAGAVSAAGLPSSDADASAVLLVTRAQ